MSRDIAKSLQQASANTYHGKESVIAPMLAELLDCRVKKVDGFDTDLYCNP